MKRHFSHQFKKWYLLLLIPFVISCKTSTVQNDLPKAKYTVNLQELGAMETDSIGQFVKRASLIPLETIEESLIERASEVELTDAYVYVLDSRGQKLVQIFDRKGNHITHVGSTGRGPGEYIGSSDIDFNEKNQELFILDYGQDKILKFDKQGKFLDEVYLKEELARTRNFISLDDGGFLLKVGASSSASSDGVVALIDEEGNKLKTYFEDQGIYTVQSNKHTFRRYRDNIYYIPIYSNTVHLFDQSTKEFSPYLNILGEEEPDYQLFAEIQAEIQQHMLNSGGDRSFDKYHAPWNIHGYFETDEIIYAGVAVKGMAGFNYFILDKRTGTSTKVFLGDDIFTEGTGFTFNNISGKEELIRDYWWAKGGGTEEEKKALVMKYIEDPTDEKYKERVNNLTIYDNPVLAIYEFKE